MWSLPMNNEQIINPSEDELRMISAQREYLYDWVVSRFRHLMATEDINSALDFADEWFEWLNPELLNTESTLFFNENELQELYESCTE